MVYEIQCNESTGSFYFGQTSRHVTTKISEQQKKNSQLGQHLVECSGSTNNIELKILDACRIVEKNECAICIITLEIQKHGQNWKIPEEECLKKMIINVYMSFI